MRQVYLCYLVLKAVLSEDVLVVFKPPGWEVDLGPQEASREKGRLSEFVLSMYPRCHSSLLSDVSKQHGFLHRLDVPCSGLLLVATTHKAYFDLHFQLATAALIRDYVVVTRGWMSPQRREIQAPVHWWDSAALSEAPSIVLPSGRASQSFLKVLAHLVQGGAALSLLAIRIGTGRRHQIRVHAAHTGHVLVTDGKYSSSAEYKASLVWCPRNFLHRYRLAFQGLHGDQVHVSEVLPSDLDAALFQTTVIRASMDLRFWREGAKLLAWDRCPVLEPKTAEPSETSPCI